MSYHTITKPAYDLFRGHRLLKSNGLVSWTQGNISIHDKDSGIVWIKPSGVHYEDLKPSSFVPVTMDGDVIPDIFKGVVPFKPSTDLWSHLYVYSNSANLDYDIGSIVHTHSPYATVVAASGLHIPAITTSIAETFGYEIPCAPYCRIGGAQIGKDLVRSLSKYKSQAVLFKQHGVFTVGATMDEALKAAVLVEDAARIFLLATSARLPMSVLSQAECAFLYNRYRKDYGQ